MDIYQRLPGTYGSSHRQCSIEQGFLKKFTKFTGKHLCLSFFLNKVAGLRNAALLKRRLRCKYFPVNFAKLLKSTFLIELLRENASELPVLNQGCQRELRSLIFLVQYTNSKTPWIIVNYCKSFMNHMHIQNTVKHL